MIPIKPQISFKDFSSTNCGKTRREAPLSGWSEKL